MASLPELLEQLNVVNCAAGDVHGTGLAGCKIDRDRVVALGLLDPSYIFEDEITGELLQQLQIQGKLLILKGVVSFTDSTPDDNILTREGSGNKSLIGKLPYEYTATFDNGVNFQKALTALSGNGNYRLMLFDVDDKFWLTQSKSGAVRGYSLTMHEGGKYLGKDGVNAASQTLFVQLASRPEIDSYMTWGTMPDASVDDLDGVNDISITFDPVAAAATTLVFTPLLADKTHLVEGLAIANLKFTKNGSALVPSGISYVTNPGKVTVTVPSVTAADVYTVETWTAAEASNITQVTVGTLYKSPIATVTATA